MVRKIVNQKLNNTGDKSNFGIKKTLVNLEKSLNF